MNVDLLFFKYITLNYGSPLSEAKAKNTIKLSELGSDTNIF